MPRRSSVPKKPEYILLDSLNMDDQLTDKLNFMVNLYSSIGVVYESHKKGEITLTSIDIKTCEERPDFYLIDLHFYRYGFSTSKIFAFKKKTECDIIEIFTSVTTIFPGWITEKVVKYSSENVDDSRYGMYATDYFSYGATLESAYLTLPEFSGMLQHASETMHTLDYEISNKIKYNEHIEGYGKEEYDNFKSKVDFVSNVRKSYFNS